MNYYLLFPVLITTAVAASLGPRQTCFVQLLGTHLDSARIGWLDKGDPDVRITIENQVVYTLRQRRPDAKGIDFKCDELIELVYTPGDKIKVELYDVDTISDDIIFEQSTSSVDAINELFSYRLASNGSWIEIRRVYPRGRYLIRLERSFVGPDDFSAVGGVGEVKKLEIKQLHLLPYVANLENVANDLYVGIDKLTEPIDNRILVYQNGKKIADTSARVVPKGPAVNQWNVEFEILWEPNDDIKILYEDMDVLSNDAIMEARSNTDRSLSMLSGPIYGGRSQQSFIVFSARKLRN